ncbi:MAG TPA: NAD-dependent epimerase/dehydratase family protein [Stellaceae bacterium]|nr:NAD-dependent epimerase/dehydratase family protein [Stellaceae bacterium]
MKKRALVTGGAGFIGSHLVDRLVERDRAVTVLDDFSTGRTKNLAEAQRRGDVRIIEGSVLDPKALDAAMTDIDRVFHLAVQCVRRSLRRPVENHEINATGTLLALEAARRAEVGCFVYCSSSEVYGNCGGDRLNEESTQCAPVTVYGAAKLAGEYYAKAYWQTYGLPVVIVRPFNAYGPREHESGDLGEVIPRFIIRLLNRLPPVVFGSGENGRDFTYVTEIAHGIALAGDCDALLGRVVNLAYGKMITISELAEAAAQVCGCPEIRPLHIEARPGDVMALRADISLAHRLLGFQAAIDLHEGLSRYLAWFRAHHNDVSVLLEAEPRNW